MPQLPAPPREPALFANDSAGASFRCATSGCNFRGVSATLRGMGSRGWHRCGGEPRPTPPCPLQQAYISIFFPADTLWTGKPFHGGEGVELEVDKPFDHPNFPI